MNTLKQLYLWDITVMSNQWMYIPFLVPIFFFLIFFIIKWVILTLPIWIIPAMIFRKIKVKK
jgi:hypothetical protein